MTKFVSRMTKRKSAGKDEMDAFAIVTEAKRMNRELLSREFRGPGDTREAAAYRNQVKLGVPATTALRLWNRDFSDMLVSSLAPVLNAYLAVKDKANKAADRMEHAYEEERNRAVDPRLVRLADAIRGKKTQETEE